MSLKLEYGTMTVYRNKVMYLVDPSELGDSDIIWWVEHGISSKPDIWAPQLGLHTKTDLCCGVFVKIIYSYFMNDWSGTGAKVAHQAHCTQCGGKIGGMLPHKIEADQVGDTVLFFGKHKGKPLKEVPVDYLKWCSENLKDQKTVKKINIYLGSTVDTDGEGP